VPSFLRGLRVGWFISLIAAACGGPQSLPTTSVPYGFINIGFVPVPLNPKNPSEFSFGEFVYAGGLALTSGQTNRLHELSDMSITDNDKLTAVGTRGFYSMSIWSWTGRSDWSALRMLALRC
jgi:hypothetical protein